MLVLKKKYTMTSETHPVKYQRARKEETLRDREEYHFMTNSSEH